MSKREILARYNLIIKKLRRYPASFDEITDYLAWESELQGYNFNVSKRTFQRDLEDIRSLYNIDIQYDFSSKVYHISDDESPVMNERMLEAFDTFNALNIADRLSSNIYFEKRRPQGTENLYGLLHAIKNRLQINFQYHKFWENKPTNRTVEPYALREFKHRWYLLSMVPDEDKIKTFALDRISNLDISRKKFELQDNFDVDEYFKYSFGIITPIDQKPEEVILSFVPHQGKYIKTLPMHASQEVLVDDENEFRIQLKIYITFDFRMELLSYAANVKVLQPQSLIEEIQQLFKEALDRY